jgi:serine/threonine protein kinase
MSPQQLESAAHQISANLGLTFAGRVGAGAFKETYKVIDSSSDAFALKIYRPGFPAERTQREIEAMQRCSHSGIAKLVTLAKLQWQGTTLLYSLEEFIPGGTLSHRLATSLLSPTETAALGAKLIDAVEHIAAQNLVHRDLKPDNIMFRQDGTTPVIVDFGIVRDLKNSSLTGSWQVSGPGTPFFSSPEQLRNEKNLIDWRSDQFSLGVVLALSSLGFHPYADQGLSDAEVVQRVADRRSQPDPFKAAAKQVGLPVLVDMTAPWPVERIRTPRELATGWARQRRQK